MAPLQNINIEGASLTGLTMAIQQALNLKSTLKMFKVYLTSSQRCMHAGLHLHILFWRVFPS